MKVFAGLARAFALDEVHAHGHQHVLGVDGTVRGRMSVRTLARRLFARVVAKILTYLRAVCVGVFFKCVYFFFTHVFFLFIGGVCGNVGDVGGDSGY